MDTPCCRRWRVSVAVLCLLLSSPAFPRSDITVLIHMMDAQKSFFEHTIIAPFEKEHDIAIDVVAVDDIDAIEPTLARYRGKAGLVKIPFGKSWSMVHGDLILPLTTILSPQELKEFNDTYVLTWLGKKDGLHYFIPRKYETRIMAYREKQVQQAIKQWNTHKENAAATLKQINGAGFPKNFTLESDPNEWDFFDIFAVGWVWAHTQINGAMKPRIAHRGKYYSGTSLRLIDRVFQCGGDSASLFTMADDAVVDAIEWEAVYAAADIYNPRMWKESWSGADIWDGFASHDVFLSFMTQIDCFFLHGSKKDNIAPKLDDPDDLGLAVMPRGCSVVLGSNGLPLRRGKKIITTGGWWWAVPKGAPNPQLSFQLAQHILSKENQVHECTRFGMVPVRADIVNDHSILFGKDWISDVFLASYRQIQINNNNVVPSNPYFDDIASCYLDAWNDIVVQKNWSVDKRMPNRNHILMVLKSTYMPKVLKILHGK